MNFKSTEKETKNGKIDSEEKRFFMLSVVSFEDVDAVCCEGK